MTAVRCIARRKVDEPRGEAFRAVDDHEVITVKRSKGGDAVLLSKDDYDSLAETAYLLRSPNNQALKKVT